MKGFPIKECPLCQGKLYLVYQGKVQQYKCKEAETFSNEDYQSIVQCQSHYAVVVSGSIVTQEFVIPPYLIKNERGSSKSKIYQFPPTSQWNEKLIIELPMIYPENPEKIIKKIKTLVLFS